MQVKTERLQKILSAGGIASRREAERMILAGRVFVNGIQAKTGQSAVFGVDSIVVDNVPLIPVDKHVYLMLNKPGGYLTTSKDERGRQTVMELVADAGCRIYPVGRLDLHSEGLLIFTNDGEFAHKVMHPSFNKQKSYEVTVRGNTQRAAEMLRLPVNIDNYVVNAISVKIIEETHTGGRILIKISEGRNRQIRKMCNACGLKVRALKRVSIGELTLGALETGKWRYLTPEEVLLLSSGK